MRAGPDGAAAPAPLAGPLAIVAAYVMAQIAASLVILALAGVSGTGLRLAESYLVPGLALLVAGVLAAWPGWLWAAAGLVAGGLLKLAGDLALVLEAHIAGAAPLGNNPLALAPQDFRGPLPIAAVVVAAVVVAPLGEEFFFRGLIYGWLRGRWRWPAAAGVASVVFALAHGNWGLLLPLALAGFGLCWLYERSRSLWPPVLAHATLNAVAVLAALVR